MDFLVKLFCGGLLQGLSALVGPLFQWLNKRVDADVQKHVVDTKAISDVSTAGLNAITTADSLNAQIRMKEPTWGPTVLMMAAVLSPFVWHEWQIVLDSCRWIPALDTAWGWLPYPSLAEHRIGSWGVSKLGRPDGDGYSIWDHTEQAIFQSLFIGATAGVVTVQAIKAIKR